ncbi:hypothetical protein KGF57_003623 [Candida theae]|uniref:4'-phosphopantetheinyl transferase domain-containing protein n=1 Tax=Candida theae TaxID=1198502 RepID=A0AAD5FXT9_9ASCO|nr:uncharacterized protein KGF57_003623 [Candida theae]KAI5955491.1 hypothetical protein KGF57_003623 [Candida theae]
MSGCTPGAGRKAGLVVAIGVDIIKTSRFEKLLRTKTTSFAERLSKRILHHTHELPKFNEMDAGRQVQFMAGSWAAKEALFKTLHQEEQDVFNFNEWYRYNNSSGKPFISNDKYDYNNEEFHLSISHDDSLVIATVLRQKLYSLDSKGL